LTHKNYLSGIALVAALGWAALIIVFYRLDPFTSTALALPFFFLALFLALTGTTALAGFYGRVWLRSGEIYYDHLTISLRQGVLLASAVCFGLGFQILRVLTWWDAVLIVAAVSLIEIYFSSRD
jgi:hypothetical protein